MRPEPLATVLSPLPLAASGWASWAPDIAEAAPEAAERPETAPAFWLGGVLTLLMWGFASVLAVWYW